MKEGDIPKEETCAICFCELLDDDGDVVVKLSECTGHYFHKVLYTILYSQHHTHAHHFLSKGCITHCYSAGYIQCPCCNHVYGVRVGNMPSGTMNVTKSGKVIILSLSLSLAYMFISRAPTHYQALRIMGRYKLIIIFLMAHKLKNILTRASCTLALPGSVFFSNHMQHSSTIHQKQNRIPPRFT